LLLHLLTQEAPPEGHHFSRKFRLFLSFLLLNQPTHQSHQSISFKSTKKHGLEGKQLFTLISYIITACRGDTLALSFDWALDVASSAIPLTEQWTTRTFQSMWNTDASNLTPSAGLLDQHGL